MQTLTTCNSCDSKPMAEGQESPDELGYCFDCLAEVVMIVVFDGVEAHRQNDGSVSVDDVAQIFSDGISAGLNPRMVGQSITAAIKNNPYGLGN